MMIILNMKNKKQSTLTTEKVLPEFVLNENAKALEFYKTYKAISDIAEKIDIAMGRRKIYKYSSGSTQNIEIDPHALPPAIQSYTV